eukprot:TRINITY_DN26708_c0_g1_i1.p1 TRINITY_DN26708_c0_g1~~TRINITY_DN26708_c0_g1_i1.p1  ORF type:complete len:118 (-),score=17.33 TRINITY_DN26708_c0_g1_i1:310-639(-)
MGLSFPIESEMNPSEASFWFEAVSIPIIGCIGLVGNISLIAMYAKKKSRNLMDDLLLTVCCFDILTILLMFFLFPYGYFHWRYIHMFDQDIVTFLTPYVLFLCNASIVR